MMTVHLVIDCETGKQTEVPLTAKEAKALDKERAEAAALLAAEAEAEQAAIHARAVLAQQIDPTQPDPTPKELADALARVALS